MNPQVTPASPRERETLLETLVIQAELGQDELVRTSVATLPRGRRFYWQCHPVYVALAWG